MATSPDVSAAAAALFSRAHTKVILPALIATTSSHPRLHTLWSYVLPFLIPGFMPAKQQRQVGEAGVSKGRLVVGAQLDAVWSIVVEGGLMDSSHERK
jgi:DNA polymerase phi